MATFGFNGWQNLTLLNETGFFNLMMVYGADWDLPAAKRLSEEGCIDLFSHALMFGVWRWNEA